MKVDNLKNYIDISELYKRLNLELATTTPATGNEIYNISSTNLSGLNSETTLPQLSSLDLNNLNNQQLPLLRLQLQLQQPSTPNKDSKKTITFILQDGSVKRVNITGCFNAQAIKRKIAKNWALNHIQISLILIFILRIMISETKMYRVLILQLCFCMMLNW